MNNLPDPNDKPSLLTIIRTLNSGAENDIAYIVAASFNVYNESRRRLFGKVLMTPEDVKAVLQIVDLLLTDRSDEALPPARSRQLSKEEEKVVLQGIDGEVKVRRV